MSDDDKPKGSGPGGRVELSDIQKKLDELSGGAEEAVAEAKPILTYVAVGAAVVVIGLAFLLGKRSGKKKTTWVEIKRK